MCVCVWVCVAFFKGNIAAFTPDKVTSGLPQLPASQVVAALSKWDGMGDTLAIFDELLKAEKSE